MRLRKLVLALALQQFIMTFAQAQTLRIGLQDDPDILDPTVARLFVSNLVLATICDRLFVVSPDGRIVPQLATGLSYSDDHRTLELELRHGVRFQDGEPFNAAAVKYNFERNLTLPGSTAKSYLGPITNVEVIDDHRVKIDLSSPFPPLMAQFASRPGMMISPKSAVAAGGDFGKHPVCAGPFKFVDRVAQDRIVLERFQDYWDKENIFINRVVFRPIADSSIRLANLRSGDLDLIERMAATHYVDMGKYPQLRGSAISGFADFYFYIMFNLNNGPRSHTPLGQDSRVREAFELAIDREVINEVVFAGQYIPTNQWLPPKDPFYAQALPIPKRDVVKARELLAAAGVPHPTVELMINNVPEVRQMGELLQAMTGEAGFDLRVRPTETASAYQASRSGDFEAFLTAFLGRGDPDTVIYPTLACGGPYNDGRYCNPEVENLLSDARTRFAPEERRPLYQSAASIILRERANVYLMVRPFLFGYSTKLSGFRPIPGGLIHLQGVKLN